MGAHMIVDNCNMENSCDEFLSYLWDICCCLDVVCWRAVLMMMQYINWHWHFIAF